MSSPLSYENVIANFHRQLFIFVIILNRFNDSRNFNISNSYRKSSQTGRPNPFTAAGWHNHPGRPIGPSGPEIFREFIRDLNKFRHGQGATYETKTYRRGAYTFTETRQTSGPNQNPFTHRRAYILTSKKSLLYNFRDFFEFVEH